MRRTVPSGKVIDGTVRIWMRPGVHIADTDPMIVHGQQPPPRKVEVVMPHGAAASDDGGGAW